jgi:colanic acid biosynthesis glycosyl transferase WcaI
VHKLTNIKCLPYQPLAALSASLSAADLHIVVMGDPFVGIIHPCKVYNIMAVGSRMLYIGPKESHVTDLAPYLNGQLLTARHEDPESVVRHILNAARSESDQNALDLRNDKSPFSQEVLLPQLCAIVESASNTIDTLRQSIPNEPVLSVTNEHGT